MVDILTILEGLAYVGFIAGAIFAVVELRTISKDRKTQLVIDLMRHCGTVEFAEQAQKVLSADYSTGKQAFEKVGIVPLQVFTGFYEQLGLLLKLKLVDANVVHDSMGIVLQWEKVKPYCLWLRAELGEPSTYENFEYAAESQRAWNAKHMRKMATREAKVKKGV